MAAKDSATGSIRSQGKLAGSQSAKWVGQGTVSTVNKTNGKSGFADRWGIGVDPASIPGAQLRQLLLERQRAFYGLSDPSNYLWNNLVPLKGTNQPGGAALPPVDPAVLAREAAATLRLPTQTVRIGPEPSLNQWNMMAVGYPIWLWREGASTTSETVSLAGVTLDMTARHQSTTFDMGDGTKETCTASTPWVAGARPPGTPSPNCGHVYSKPGNYTITATHHWQLSWTALGQSGALPMSNTSSADLVVGELASVVVER
ncbi:hypothetical protein [Raineyella sp. W15-4]|uniref:hypothetical protein n=1 Tax=Raineyella sp. W15-4 TaxID=3081651 RepID=UPI002955286B|nr:hypothetical protein [Raineyella sp. W15-4]WOQ17552.1 hypothetical protein R0145_02235 [Raineyella sp. W15-4]